MLSDEAKKRKKEYDIKYIKEHKKRFVIDLNIEDYIKLDNELKKLNISKAEFMRNAIEEFYKKNGIK